MKVYPYHTPDGIIELVEKRELNEARAEAAKWKANHDNQVALKSAIIQRPDLRDRAERVQSLIQERDALCKALELIEDRFVDGENTYDDWLYMGVTARQALAKIKKELSWPEQIKVNTAIAHHTNEELALGFLRYEALRKVSPRQFSEFHGRNLAGENFDDMITRLAFQKT